MIKAELQKNNIRPPKNQIVKFKDMGNISEIFWQSTKSSGGTTKKISADEYIDLRTGELKAFSHTENRSEDMKSVYRSLAEGRDLLNTNIQDVKNCRWLTLTYVENMTDSKRLRSDFMNFNARLREIVGQYEYIVAAEPQGRGAWHLHAVLIFPDKAPYISNKVISDAWKQGFVTIKKLDDVDNVGAYLTAYLGDMEIEECKDLGYIYSPEKIKTVDFLDDTGQPLKKKYVKGARLKMYPPGFHIFRWSKGIKKPDISFMTEEQAKEKVSADTLTFEKTVIIENPAADFKSTLNYRYYNSKRRKSQTESD